MIKRGDVLIRFLPQFQVWHWGIVVEIYSYDLDGIMVMEFTDSDKIDKVTLRAFCYYRKYFWVHNFTDELQLYGPNVFRSRQDRIRTAYTLYKENMLTYNISKYNCEYFCRRCVFNKKSLWASRQTDLIARSTKTFFAKLITVLLSNAFIKFDEMLELEKDNRPHDIRYTVANNSFNLN
jgi:hypothetical protein